MNTNLKKFEIKTDNEDSTVEGMNHAIDTVGIDKANVIAHTKGRVITWQFSLPDDNSKTVFDLGFAYGKWLLNNGHLGIKP